uniref:KilA-N domain-containing protein n=1 Tax=viral metagenome TaxID=1070528 RepID=A0A6C0CRI7_9ZZZZ
MNTTTTMEQHDINETYRMIKYLNIDVIEDKRNGFINVSKICKQFGKMLKNYNSLESSKKYMLYKSAVAGKTATALSYELCGGLTEFRQQLKGTYVHKDIAVHVAMWCDPVFGDKVSKIINEYIQNENKQLKIENKKLMLCNEIQQKIIQKREIYTTSLEYKLDVFREEQRIRDEEMKQRDEEMKQRDEEMKQRVDALINTNDALINMNVEQTELLHDIRQDVALTNEIIQDVHEQIVAPNENNRLTEKLVLLSHTTQPNKYTVIRTQERNERTAITRKQRQYNNQLRVIMCIDTYMNPKNLYNRFKEHMQRTPELKPFVRFIYNDFEIIEGTTLSNDDLVQLFQTIEQQSSEPLTTAPITIQK